jgi:amino acid permease
MLTALLIVHGLVAVALLGAISHQVLATWAPSRARPNSFFGRFRAVPSASYANAIVVLYAVTALLGGIVYLYFRTDIRPDLERAGEWPALGLFDLKEHFVSIGLGLLPAYWVCWRRPLANDSLRSRAILTSVLAFIVWWGFLIGHVLNDLRGFGG